MGLNFFFTSDWNKESSKDEKAYRFVIKVERLQWITFCFNVNWNAKEKINNKYLYKQTGNIILHYNY